ncbi:MAG TPA: permease [Candidatus Methylacidiphilales bacterium]|nr:permease [Candidatus Methylacidiphilales bacterium]
MFFAAFDLPSAPASAGISWPDVALSFFAIILEGAPFLLLGAIVSGLVDVFVPAGLIKDWLPRSKARGVMAGIGAGIIFPLCDCGAMPIVQRLIRKGVPPPVAATYMLAAPALNPLALFSTYLAFRNMDPWLMVILRFAFSFAVLVFLGYWLIRVRPEEMLRPETLMGNRAGPEPSLNPGLILTPRPGLSLGGLQKFAGAVIRDFTGVLLFLVIGAAVAALFSTGFNRNILDPIGQNPFLGPLAGILLAQLLCLCSTTDAFIIAAFAPFSIPAKIAFLVSGPLIHLKLYWLYRSTFRARFVHGLWLRALAATFVLALLYSLKP